MKSKIKSLTALIMLVVMCLSLTACKDKKQEKYRDYVKSLIGINYLGATDDYIKATGASKEDAETLYNSNLELLANSIIEYYGIVISDAPELKDDYIELAKTIYSKVNYTVSKAYKEGGDYYVDVTVYPINIFGQTSDEVKTYISDFNAKVANGDYNDFELNAYEKEFSTGLIDILYNGCASMTYGDPVVIKVKIIKEKKEYYISDEDFLAIDAAIIGIGTYTSPSTDSTATDATSASETDAY